MVLTTGPTARFLRDIQILKTSIYSDVSSMYIEDRRPQKAGKVSEAHLNNENI